MIWNASQFAVSQILEENLNAYLINSCPNLADPRWIAKEMWEMKPVLKKNKKDFYCFSLCASYQCFPRQWKISHVDACSQRKSWKYTRAVKCPWFLSQSDLLTIKSFGMNLTRTTMNSTLKWSVGKPHVSERSDLDCCMPVCNVR